MSSILKVDTIQDQSGNNIISEAANVITIGASGDTITVPAGATVSGFTSAGIDDNATSTAITIDSSERVGIGTSAPTVPLMVQSNETQPLLLKGANDKQMVVETTGGSTQITSYQLKNSAYSWQIENGRSANTFTIRSSGGGERVRIDASGNFGISTSAPKEKLDSRGSAVFSGDHATATNAYGTAHGILLSSTSNLGKITAISNGSNDVKLELRGLDGGTANSNQLVLDGGTSNVGIGETSPFANVHVKVSDSGVTSLNSAASGLFIESANSTGMTIASGTSNVGRLVFADSGANLIGYVQYDHANNSMSFQTNGAERMRLTSTGLGIGLTNPTENLQISDTASNKPQIRLETSDGGNKRLDLYVDGSIGTIASDQSSQSLAFRTSNSERMRIDSSGSVGIGNTVPGDFNSQARNLVIGGGSGDTGMTIYSGSGSGDTGNIFFADGTSGSDPVRGGITYNHGDNSMNFRTNDGANRIYISSAGLVGIGTSSPSEELHVEGSGTTNAIVKSTGSGTAAAVGSVNNSGTAGKILMYGSGQGAYGSLGSGQMALYSDAAGMSIMNDNSSGAIKFSMHSGSEKMRINSDGAVSIASSNVTQNAHLNVRQDTNGHAIRTYMSATVSSGALSSIKYVRAIPAVSAGTQLIIPFISQNNINSKTYVHVRGLSCESNTKDPKAFDCKFAVGHTSTLSNLTVLENLGKCTGASISGMNIVLAFSVDYTHSGDSGMFIELDYIAHHQDASINLSGIVMN